MAPKITHRTEVRRILVASPEDIKQEYRILSRVLNDLSAAPHGMSLRVSTWRETAEIRKLVASKQLTELTSADLVILLLWKRWGSQTGKYSSFFSQVYSLAGRLAKPVLLYFRDLPDTVLVSPDEQASAVIRFRDMVETAGSFFHYWYEDEKHLAKLMKDHLRQWLDGRLPPGAVVESLPLHRKRLEGWTEAIRKIKPGKSKRAFSLARRGFVHASGRRFTKACQCLAQAIALAPEPYIINEYGLFLKENGLLNKSERVFQHLARIGQTRQDRLISASAQRHLGDISAIRKNLQEADRHYEKALAAERGLSRFLKEGELYDSRAGLQVEFGQYDAAQRFYEKAIELFEKADFPHGQALSCLNLLDMFMRREDAVGAYHACKKALEIVDRIGEHPKTVDELRGLLDELRTMVSSCGK